MRKLFTTFVLSLLSFIGVQAQLSSNPNKFLGNITTSYNVDAGGGVPQYYKLWNQITCENESKWSSVEGTRGSFNWGGADRAFNYAKQYNFTYKFHALVWGAQYPGWLDNLSAGERFDAMTNWFNHAKAHYETLPMIDVVNEAVGNHQAGNPMIKETLGGGGKTGYDWLIKAFEMAYERWPDAILIYNDYNSLRWNVDEYIDLVRTLRDAGAPIDAYGNQSHDVNDISESELRNVLQKQQDALKMPMFITELDIDKANDAQQKAQYQNVLPAMWEAPYCAGVTLWGYVFGRTWVDNSGLYKNGEERPAMTWIREYMQTDAAKNAAGPFPGTKKEASIYIRPAALKVAYGDVLPIKVRAKMATKTIEKVELYVEDELVATMTEAPYIAEYTASKIGTNKLVKAVVTTTDGSTYERYSRISVAHGTKRTPYNETVPQLPGTIKIEEYDKGMSGVAYSSNASRNTSLATKDGQWMEYTVDVTEDGLYSMEVEIASTKTGGMFHLSEYGFDNLTFYTGITSVPNTGGTTEFQTLRCPMTEPLTAGRHVFCLNIDKGGFYIKNMTFKLLPTINLPGVLEIEDFAKSSSGIDIISGNGGSVLGNTAKDEWLEYSVNFTEAGKYSYDATFSSTAVSSFSLVLIEEDGTEKTLANVTLPKTGSLDSYQVKTGKIRNAIKAGKQTLRITVTGGNFNFDKVEFTCIEPSGITELTDDDTATGNTYNISGQKVNDNYRGIIIRNGKIVIKR